MKHLKLLVLLILLTVPANARGMGSVCVDTDLDGWGTGKISKCKYTDKQDCNDFDSSINPGAKEVCGDGKDNNCNGVVDENCSPNCDPNMGRPCSVGVGECKRDGTLGCSAICNAQPGLPSPEVPCDGKDNDCNGVTDDILGAPCTVGVGECANQGTILCGGSCSVSPSNPNPEVCNNGKDEDCDGVVDNGCAPTMPPVVINRVFKGSYDRATQTNFVATRYKLGILVESGASRTADLKAANPNFLILRYTKFAGTHSPVTRPPNGDYFWSLANGTPNLIWYGPSGNPMKQSQFGWYFIDIMHNDMTAWAQKQKDFQSSDTGKYDGEFLDSAGPQTVDLVSEYPTNYSSLPKSDPGYNNDYSNAAVNLMAKIRAANPNSILIPNGYAGWMPAGFRGLEFTPNSNGIMFEGFARKASMKYLDPARYEQHVTDFCTAAAGNKTPIATDYISVVEESDSKVRTYLFATYLLSATANSYIYTIGSTDVALYPEDSLTVGSPATTCFEKDHNVLRRNFSSGITVLVNMSGVAQTITFPGTIEKMQTVGNTAWNGTGSIQWVPQSSVVTIANQEAMILRTK